MAEGRPPSVTAGSTSTSRPMLVQVVFSLLFVAISAAGLWCMRIEPGLSGYPVGYEETVATGVFPNGQPLRMHYTGIEALDLPLRFLVPAFMPGVAGWDVANALHDLHFLISFTAVIAIWNAEASRDRSKGKLYRYTGIFAILYQTVGGVVIVPLWYLCHLISTRADGPGLLTGRGIEIRAARALLPSTLLGYFMPTLLMFMPWANPDVNPIAIAAWQFCPLWANLILLVLSNAPDQDEQWIKPNDPLGPTPAPPLIIEGRPVRQPERRPAPKPGDDLPELKQLYRALLIVSAAVHGIVLFMCLRGKHPQVSLARVFVPQFGARMDSFEAGLHWLFQCDWLGIAVSSLLWCWVSVYDVMRTLLAGDSARVVRYMAAVGLGMVVVGLLTGPATVMALTWTWREDRLVMIEDGVRGTITVPKKEKADNKKKGE